MEPSWVHFETIFSYIYQKNAKTNNELMSFFGLTTLPARSKSATDEDDGVFFGILDNETLYSTLRIAPKNVFCQQFDYPRHKMDLYHDGAGSYFLIIMVLVKF